MVEKAKLSVKLSKKNKKIVDVIAKTRKGENRVPAPGLDASKITIEMHDAECAIIRKEGMVVSLIIDGKEYISTTKPDKGKTPSQHHRPPRSQANRTENNPHDNELSEVYDVSNSKLPNFAKDALRQDDSIDNFYLQFFKGAPYLIKQGTKKGKSTEHGFKVFLQASDKRKTVLNNFKPEFQSVDFASITKRREKTFKSFGKNQTYFTASPDWRLIVGLGNPSVYEVSMTLHHIYGFPYIPGSALKGIARYWAATEEFADNSKDEHKALQNEIFRAVFGHEKAKVEGKDVEAHRGCITFHDAYPIEAPKLEPDVMNPHYGPYYSEKKPPADYYDPVPVTFLTVSKTNFMFYLTLDSKFLERAYPMLSGTQVLETAREWLKAALTGKGVGAKSAVGYGYMEVAE